jgi:CheY-like chemotaxis protein
MTPAPQQIVEFDISELVTQVARTALREARVRGLLSLYDYEGPPLTVRGPRRALAELLDHAVLHSISLARTGHVFLRARVGAEADGRCSIDIQIAGAGIDATDAGDMPALQNFTGVSWSSVPADGGEDVIAFGRSEIAQASLSVQAVVNEGALVRLTTQLEICALEDDLASADARGARVWLIADPPFAYEALIRRLQRLGWTTTLYRSVSDAVQAMLPLGAGSSAPALVMASQFGGVLLGDLATLMRSLPPTTRAVYTTPELQHQLPPDVAGRTVLLAPPFSPRELAQLTIETLQYMHPAPSGDTKPVPLSLQARKHVLVVDDNPVNQILAREMVQLLGFEADVVADGAEAIEYCRRHAPHAVLMDLQMPVMDGMEATRRLRALQQEGVLPRFAIIATTASAVTCDECVRAGMDGYVAKPLRLAELGVVLEQSARLHDPVT